MATIAQPAVRRAGRTAPMLDRIGGVGGLLFVALLVIQNVIRASAPGFGASPEEVSAYFLDHRAAAIVPLGLFPIGMVALACFVAGIWRRAEGDARGWAYAGVFGASCIAALFAMVNVVEIAMAAVAGHLTGSADTVRMLWAVHAGAFGLDLAAIAVALVGLSQAARRSGLVPAWTAYLALVGGACLLVASLFTVAIAEGAPWIALGLVGFVIWGVFVVAAGIGLLRAGGAPVTR